MTVRKLKEILYARAAEYWAGAAVIGGEPPPDGERGDEPYVALKLGAVSRASPITRFADGVTFSAYPSKAVFTVSLIPGAAPGAWGAEGDAVSDLLDFMRFLDAPSSLDWSRRHDVCLSLEGDVRDLSDETKDDERPQAAQCTLIVSFTAWTAEYHGVLGEDSIRFDDDGRPIGVVLENWKPTQGGGGTHALSEESTGFFEEITPQQGGMDKWET